MRPVLAFIPAGGDTQTITVGGTGNASFATRRRGFLSGSFGSIVDGTSNIYGGAAITQFYWDEGGDPSDPSLSAMGFAVSGLFANSGWETVTIGTTVFTRSSSGYAQSGGSTFWDWDSVSNPFGFTIGAIKTVVFT